MSQAAAAEAAGVNATTVRRWRKGKTIAERRAPDDSRTVEVFLTAEHRQTPDAEVATSPSSGRGEEPRSELGVLVPLEIHQRSLAELILRLTDTTERAVRAEARVEVLEAQLAELGPSPADPTGTLRSASPRQRKKG